MSLFKKKNDIQKVEVSESHTKLRIVLASLFLVIGLGFIAFFLIRTLTEEPGWQTIELTNQNYMEAGEIALNYDLGRGDASATAEKRELQRVYNEEMLRVYRLFDAFHAYENVANVYHINLHPNEVLVVDPALYNAFALLEAHGDRSLYLSPIQAQYRNLFMCSTDENAMLFDPYLDEDMKAYAAEIAAFAKDPASIRIELLEHNQVRLVVSQDYLDYAAENELDSLIDFTWLGNAFVVDIVADSLVARGFTRGYLISCDGYTRYLDNGASGYSIPLYDRVGQNIYSAAEAETQSVKALVQFRDYPFPSERARDYYGYADGRCATRYVSAEDGLYKSALSDLSGLSATKGCAEIALTLASAYIADDLDESKLTAAATEEISAIWCVDRVVYYTADALTLNHLFDNGTIRYTAVSVP